MAWMMQYVSVFEKSWAKLLLPPLIFKTNYLQS
jgi:hypothetical protein